MEKRDFALGHHELLLVADPVVFGEGERDDSPVLGSGIRYSVKIAENNGRFLKN